MKADSAIYEAFDDHTPIDPAVAERNLMRAMLRLALDDLRKGGDPAEDAKDFLLSDEEQYLFSFMSICRELNFCAETVRKISGLWGEPEEPLELNLDPESEKTGE